MQSAETRAAFNGDSLGKRHRLLPVLHAIQNRIGWISPGALNYVSLRLGRCPRRSSWRGVVLWNVFARSPVPRLSPTSAMTLRA